MDVKGDGNCSYHIVSAFPGKGEENHRFVCQYLIKELKKHKESYTKLYGGKEYFDEIHESLIPFVSGPTPEAK